MAGQRLLHTQARLTALLRPVKHGDHETKGCKRGSEHMSRRNGLAWSADGDYTTLSNGKRLLNPFLYRELMDVIGPTGEIHCFDHLLKELDHFVKQNELPAERLPKGQEAEEIQKELQAITTRHVYAMSDQGFVFSGIGW
jgi:hypothetical protein